MALGTYDEGSFALPHPPISLSVFLIVEEALRSAWKLLRNHPRPGFNILNAPEDTITHELYEILCDRVFNKGVVNGFNQQLFTPPTRESKLRNYDGAELDKMPDLRIGLVNRPRGVRLSQDGIFIECKPVDLDHPTGSNYCDKGLLRFVCGGYAWAMTEALMIGYARAGYTILPKLHDALDARRDTIPTLVFPKPCHKSQAEIYSESSHVSQHKRTFKYVENEKSAPPITVRHLWLRRD